MCIPKRQAKRYGRAINAVGYIKKVPSTKYSNQSGCVVTFDNNIKIAFIISVFFHSIIFFAWPAINILLPKKPVEQFEITYAKIKDFKTFPRKKYEPAPKQVIEKKVPPEKPAPAPAPEPAKFDSVIPPLPKGVEKLPAYLDYVQSVRERIKRRANSMYSPAYQAGDVLLNFVLLSDGRLSVLKIINERSSQDERLRRIAQSAIENAAPFNRFPQDLEYNQLSFSVIISFE